MLPLLSISQYDPQNTIIALLRTITLQDDTARVIQFSRLAENDQIVELNISRVLIFDFALHKLS